MTETAIKSVFEQEEKQKIAFLTGITSQDGSYLSELLLEKEYEVYGIVRRASNFNTQRIDHLMDHPRFHTMFGNLEDFASILQALNQIKQNHPNLTRLEVYHLGAQSHVKVSFDIPIETGQVTAIGTANVLEAIKQSGLMDNVRFYFAATSELFGLIQEPRQNEQTPFYPRSPYACAKLYSYWMTKQYKEAYGLYACSGLLFNHESARRGRTFVTRKITDHIGKVLKAIRDHRPISFFADPDQVLPVLKIGNLDALRDWSDARDMVRGMWLMLQQPIPNDYVLSSDENHSVREFIEISFAKRGIPIIWSGSGIDEKGYHSKTRQLLVEVSQKYFRPTEVEVLLGDSTKARKELNWKPEITFDKMIDDMLAEDCPYHS